MTRGRLLLLVAGLVAVGLLVWKKRTHDAVVAPGATDPERGAGVQVAAPEGEALARTPTLVVGRVSDDAGGPVAGATVCASRSEHETPRCILADESGRFRLEIAPGTYVLSAAAEGFLAQRWRDPVTTREAVVLGPGRTREHVDLVLARGGVEVRGRVHDVTGGAVPNALVVLLARGGAAVVAHASDAGEFRAWVAPGALTAGATADGYARASREAIAPGQIIELTLTPESVLEGRVVEEGTDHVVAGAKVNAGGVEVESDGDGHFRLRGLEPGRYKPRARHGDAWGTARESVLLGLAETVHDVVIELHAGVSVSGRVVLGDHGCAGARVKLHEKNVLLESTNGEADENGDVRIAGVFPGTYEVAVVCEGALAEAHYDPVKVASTPRAGLVWKVGPGLTMRGRVVDAAGDGLAGAFVHAMPSDKGDPRARTEWGGVRAEKDGSFELHGLAAGHYRMDASHDGHASLAEPLDVDVQHDVDDVKIALPSGGKIAGSVTDARGGPVADAQIEARGPAGFASSRTHDDGTFELRGVSPGTWRVYAKRDWHPLRAPGTKASDEQGAVVTVTDRETSRLKIVVESEHGELRGNVVDDQGGAISDAFVEIAREQEGSASRRVLDHGEREPVVTDNEGAFRIGKLAPGTYLVRARRKGGGEATLEHVAVGAKITLTIKPDAAITGTLTGVPPERFTITAFDAASRVNRRESFFRTGGAWSVRDLPAGSYRVTAESAAGQGSVNVALAQGERPPPLAITLDAFARVHGRIVSLEDGAPVPGLMVYTFVSGLAGGIPAGTQDNVTDANGSFTLERVAPGKSSLMAFPRAGVSEWSSVHVPIEVTGGAELELAPLPVARSRERGLMHGDLGFEARTYEDGVNRVASVRAATGLKPGDEIVSVDGHDVDGPRRAYLYESLTLVPAGTTLALGLRRGGTVTVTAMPPR